MIINPDMWHGMKNQFFSTEKVNDKEYAEEISVLFLSFPLLSWRKISFKKAIRHLEHKNKNFEHENTVLLQDMTDTDQRLSVN